jgi:hypothetical protein
MGTDPMMDEAVRDADLGCEEMIGQRPRLVIPSVARNHDRTYGHIDLETGDDAPQKNLTYSVFTNFPEPLFGIEKRQEWRLNVTLPRAVAEQLTSSDWEMVLRKLDTREKGANLSVVEATILVGRAKGVDVNVVQQLIGDAVKKNLWRIFERKQIQAGNKAWLKPASLV